MSEPTLRERAKDILRFVRSNNWSEEECVQRIEDALGAAEQRGKQRKEVQGG